MKPSILHKYFLFIISINTLYADHFVHRIIYDTKIIIAIVLLVFLIKYIKDFRQKKKLQDSLELFKTAINFTLSSIIIIKDKQIEYFSDEAKKLFIVEDDSKFIGYGFIKFVHKDYRPQIIKDIKNSEKSIYDVILLKSDKQAFPALIQSKEMRVSDEVFYVLSIMDISSIKKQEQERFLFHESKLSSMGNLVGNIAHQWRQPLIQLGNIVMKLEASKMFGKELESQELDTYTQEIKTTVRFMSETINTFQDFYQLENRNTVVFDVRKPINDIINMLSGRFSNFFIQIRTEDLREINFKGIPSELAHTMLIIFENIVEVVENKDIKDAQVNIENHIENQKVVISIEDNLKGIDVKIIDKIFEPYVTTKIEKKSSGMGLYIAKTIIEEKMRGQLTVNNTNTGAIFKIILPILK